MGIKTRIWEYLLASGEIKPGSVDHDGNIYTEPGASTTPIESRFRKRNAMKEEAEKANKAFEEPELDD